MHKNRISLIMGMWALGLKIIKESIKGRVVRSWPIIEILIK
jgi:hypothetical protein